MIFSNYRFRLNSFLVGYFGLGVNCSSLEFSRVKKKVFQLHFEGMLNYSGKRVKRSGLAR